MEHKITLAKTIGNFVSSLLLGETKEIIIRMDERLKSVEATVFEVRSDIRDINARLSAYGLDITGLKVHTKYGMVHSPIVPSGVGKKLLEDSGFVKAYPLLRPKIFALMNARRLRTLYDYERGAERALRELQNDPLIDCLKEYAVNHPEEPLELIFRVASWVIRDDYAKDAAILPLPCSEFSVPL
jgi:hypothetical protein